MNSDEQLIQNAAFGDVQQQDLARLKQLLSTFTINGSPLNIVGGDIQIALKAALPEPQNEVPQLEQRNFQVQSAKFESMLDAPSTNLLAPAAKVNEARETAREQESSAAGMSQAYGQTGTQREPDDPRVVRAELAAQGFPSNSEAVEFEMERRKDAKFEEVEKLNTKESLTEVIHHSLEALDAVGGDLTRIQDETTRNLVSAFRDVLTACLFGVPVTGCHEGEITEGMAAYIEPPKVMEE